MNIECNRKLTILCLLILVINSYILISLITTSVDDVRVQCYHSTKESLPDVSEVIPKKDKSIFFHETSCNSDVNGKIVITVRQACAVESAAYLNPNFEVYLLYVSPGKIKLGESESDRFLQALLSYPNIKIHRVNYGKYVKNTPVEDLYVKGKIEKSSYPQSHASDVLRYLTLWKYGGIYLDLDVIVIKSLENLPLNYAGSESNDLVAAGVLSFTSSAIGHSLATQCLRDLQYHFNGNEWRSNGPGVITKLVKRICASENIDQVIKIPCVGGFTVYPSQTFYPVPWPNWTMYFNKSSLNQVDKLSENSYVLHLWNKLSSKTKISIGTEVPYTIFAQKFCPRVYSECKSFF